MITTSKVQEYIDAGHDNYEVARWLLNLEISKHCPLSIDDLPDTVTVASEIEAIVECLDSGDYEDAINISIDGAHLILEDEGFELNIDGEEDS
ncbi:MAG: hypothetical protein EBU90_18675 [Proteobacteria bacterium]|nr:hypothetical protein [Pseudomonadota bacterium]NBP16229.1 hypothetical protein [bacterium]